MKIKKDDKVIVITGKYKGVIGSVIKSIPAENKIVVAGVNKVKKHQKPRMGDAGGMVEKELPISVSNVLYYDEKMSKPSRVGYRFLEDGTKVRFSKVSGEQIN
jgi:large subunit ribosomal protein L24